MKTKLLLLVLSMFLTLNVFAQPKKVMWVTNTDAAAQYDADWITMFVNQGFDATQSSQVGMDQAKLDFINSAAGPDIVLIARPTDSGNFGTKNGINYQDFWNAITKPLILLNPYCVRANRLNWLPTSDGTNAGIEPGGVFNPDGPKIDEVFFPSDYIFNNVDLPAVVNNTPFFGGPSSYTTYNVSELQDFTNGKVVFTNNNGGAAFIRFKKNVIAFPAQNGFPNGVAPAGDRTYFPMGTRSNSIDYYGPPTALGIKLLVNEMKLMMDPTLSVSTITEQNNFSVWTDNVQSTVNVSNRTDELKTIEIFNMTGQRVKAIKNISDYKTSIDVADLAKGIYVIKIDNIYNKKFILK
ncbi:T9SS type A sorting domain-containing protein [Mariniflexile sp.]|uniref:T9SS type A sorting domain-containing protein n=1 Tax=Mariniflexile sp. TaxID=1979402 RepID=UPI0040486CC1